jgi:hypothetical protein
MITLKLSNLKTKYKLAINIANSFTLEELEELYKEVSNFKNNKNRDIALQEILFIDFETKYGNYFKLKDCISIDYYPPSRYELLYYGKLCFSNKTFKCIFNDRFYNDINHTIALAIDYKIYKSDNDTRFIKSNIMNSFSKELSKVFTINYLDELHIIVDYIFRNRENLDCEEFNKSFIFGNIITTITISKYNVIKFEYTAENETKYIYFSKSSTSSLDMNIIIEKAISYKSQKISRAQ